MKLAFVFGTRPEIIKLSPLIRACIDRKLEFFTIHTGQHYSPSMSHLFINELELPEPDYNLDIKSSAPYRQGEHTGKMMSILEEIILAEMPSVVMVHGDTNTTLAGALVTSKISTTRSFTGFDIKLGHVEAGLRSYDRSMPEEINRVITDHLSNYLFAPTQGAKEIAIGEGIKEEKVFVTGNTIVDALTFGVDIINKGVDFLKKNGIKKNEYMLMTLHRQENVDNEKILKDIIDGVERTAAETNVPVIFPMHPRTVKMFDKFKIKPSEVIKPIEPCGFLEFLQLEANARLVFTDSGGVQEETCALGVPCVTLRTSTERPETVDVGANIIAGVHADDIYSSSKKMLENFIAKENPLGDGKASQKILDIIIKDVEK